MRNKMVFGSIVLLGLLLAACSSAPKRGEGAAEVDERSPGAATGGADTGSVSGGVDIGGAGGYAGRPWDDPANPLSQRIIYFAYDSSEVAPEYLDLVSRHARYLADHPDLSVTLEGHADERGSREYNIALGERRGHAVRSLMTVQGVSPAQIAVVSFGEEKPLDSGHDEIAWQKSRRVEIVYPVR